MGCYQQLQRDDDDETKTREDERTDERTSGRNDPNTEGHDSLACWGGWISNSAAQPRWERPETHERRRTNQTRRERPSTACWRRRTSTRRGTIPSGVEGLGFELGCSRTRGSGRRPTKTEHTMHEGTGPRRRTRVRKRTTEHTLHEGTGPRRRAGVRNERRHNNTTRTNERNKRDDDWCTLLLLTTIRAVDLAVTCTPATKADSAAKTILELLRGEVGYTRR
jgi:hypothetical protein